MKQNLFNGIGRERCEIEWKYEWIRKADVRMEGFYSIVVCATVMDVFTKKICNALMAAGLITGMVYQFLRAGPRGLCYHAVSVLLLLIVLYPVYLIKGLGAGDNKLFCVIAAYLGFFNTCKILIVALFFGAILGLINQIYTIIYMTRKIKTNDLTNTNDTTKTNSTTNENNTTKVNDSKINKNTNNTKGNRFCFSPAILLAVLLWAGGFL